MALLQQQTARVSKVTEGRRQHDTDIFSYAMLLQGGNRCALCDVAFLLVSLFLKSFRLLTSGGVYCVFSPAFVDLSLSIVCLFKSIVSAGCLVLSVVSRSFGLKTFVTGKMI